MINIGIDACNIRNSGGQRHLIEFLKCSDNYKYKDYKKIIIWSNQKLLDSLGDYEWLSKKTHYLLNSNSIFCFLYQFFYLRNELKKEYCDIVLVPGGIFISSFRPFVVISQNMLPFELKEAFRFNSLFTKLKLITIRISQIITFKNSNGTIFLSNYAKTKISDIVRFKNYEIIPHGIDFNWFSTPKEQLLFSNYNQNNKFNLTYVSAITAYKHQWNVALAVISLFDEGFPLSLTLIGPHDKQGLAKLNDVLNKFPSSKFCINYLGNIEHNNLPIYYKKADAFIYASSCENMPIILLEAMGFGLPIVCSNKGPMFEFLNDNCGLYFDPENITEIKNKIKDLFLKVEYRNLSSINSYNLAKTYSWDITTKKTLNYLNLISNVTK